MQGKNQTTKAGERTHETSCLAGIDAFSHACTCGQSAVTKPLALETADVITDARKAILRGLGQACTQEEYAWQRENVTKYYAGFGADARARKADTFPTSYDYEAAILAQAEEGQ